MYETSTCGSAIHSLYSHYNISGQGTATLHRHTDRSGNSAVSFSEGIGCRIKSNCHWDGREIKRTMCCNFILCTVLHIRLEDTYSHYQSPIASCPGCLLFREWKKSKWRASNYWCVSLSSHISTATSDCMYIRNLKQVDRSEEVG